MIEPSKIFAGECTFEAGVATLDMLPPMSALYEIAFAGRSNVGKSSLINALTGRKALARTSHTPGRTQQLNFFDIGGAFMLVDMPGYGYAKVSKKQRALWQDLIKTYLRGRANLRNTFVLVDSRHGFKDSDEDMMNMLDAAAVPYRIILTKSDKLKGQEAARVSEQTTLALKKHPAAFPEPLLVSAHKNAGIQELQRIISDIIHS